MSLFTSLFSSKVPEQTSGRKEVLYLVAVLEALCGPRVPRGVNIFEAASLKLEDNNPHNKNAVRVELRSKQVGYLSPEAANLFRQQLKAKGIPKGVGQCSAVIRGGWVSSDGRTGLYEVWLDTPTLYP
jgi:hypothetical protein